MLNGIMKALGLHLLDRYMQSVAKGEKGPGPQKAYLYLQGKKTIIGVLLAMLAAGLLAAGQNGAAAGVLAASFILIRVGLVDAAWRSSVSYSDWKFFVFLRTHGPWITGLIGTALAALTTCDPNTAAILDRFHVGSWHLTCRVATIIVTVLGVEIQLAIGNAKLADPPDGKGIVLALPKP